MEPQWMKQIPSKTICDFFYVFYIVYAAIFVMVVLLTIGTFFSAKKLGMGGIAMGLQGIAMSLLAGTTALFYYLICDRALLGKVALETQENFKNHKH